MPIYKYKVLNPVTNPKEPHIDKNGIFVFYITNPCYKYYVEVLNIKEDGSEEYYFLLSKNKFDVNCRKLNIDTYGRCRIKVRGDMKEYINNELKYRGNVDVNYLESNDEYDIYIVE